MRDYRHGGIEPPIGEILSDPIVRLVMRSDAVREEDIHGILKLMSHTMLQGRDAVSPDLPPLPARPGLRRSRRAARRRLSAVA